VADGGVEIVIDLFIDVF